jgi:hypothetical protein
MVDPREGYLVVELCLDVKPRCVYDLPFGELANFCKPEPQWLRMSRARQAYKMELTSSLLILRVSSLL